jgi:hypothetical protein
MAAKKGNKPIKKRKKKGEPNTLIAKDMRYLDYLKPPRFKDHFTLAEMAREIRCDPSWLRKLEHAGRIPQAQRVQRGKLMVRLWSPAQRDEIEGIIADHQVGRPRGT